MGESKTKGKLLIKQPDEEEEDQLERLWDKAISGIKGAQKPVELEKRLIELLNLTKRARGYLVVSSPYMRSLEIEQTIKDKHAEWRKEEIIARGGWTKKISRTFGAILRELRLSPKEVTDRKKKLEERERALKETPIPPPPPRESAYPAPSPPTDAEGASKASPAKAVSWRPVRRRSIGIAGAAPMPHIQLLQKRAGTAYTCTNCRKKYHIPKGKPYHPCPICMPMPSSRPSPSAPPIPAPATKAKLKVGDKVTLAGRLGTILKPAEPGRWVVKWESDSEIESMPEDWLDFVEESGGSSKGGRRRKTRKNRRKNRKKTRKRGRRKRRKKSRRKRR